MKLKSIKKSRLIRWGVLAASTVFFLCFAGFVSVHAVCPIGGFEIFFSGLFRTGFSFAGLFSAMVLLFLIMSVLSIVFRRAYCSYICPLGAMQELSEAVGKKVLPAKIRNWKIPRMIDRVLRWVKYGILVMFVAGAGIGAGHWMIKTDPFIAYINLFGGGSITEKIQRNPGSFLFFVGILVFSFFLGKGFCKYLCPAGAWYGILSKISPNKVARHEENCINCGLCSKACPMDIDVANLSKVASAECIGCRECVNACPKEGALDMKVGSVDIKSAAVPIAAAAVFSGSLFLTSQLGSGQNGHGGAHGPSGGDGDHSVSSVPDNAEDDAPTVGFGFGGCSDCVGCGLCRTV